MSASQHQATVSPLQVNVFRNFDLTQMSQRRKWSALIATIGLSIRAAMCMIVIAGAGLLDVFFCMLFFSAVGTYNIHQSLIPCCPTPGDKKKKHRRHLGSAYNQSTAAQWTSLPSTKTTLAKQLPAAVLTPPHGEDSAPCSRAHQSSVAALLRAHCEIRVFQCSLPRFLPCWLYLWLPRKKLFSTMPSLLALGRLHWACYHYLASAQGFIAIACEVGHTTRLDNSTTRQPKTYCFFSSRVRLPLPLSQTPRLLTTAVPVSLFSYSSLPTESVYSSISSHALGGSGPLFLGFRHPAEVTVQRFENSFFSLKPDAFWNRKLRKWVCECPQFVCVFVHAIDTCLHSFDMC